MQDSEYQHQNGMVLPQTIFRCQSFQGEVSGFRIIKEGKITITVMTMKITTIMILAIVLIMERKVETTVCEIYIHTRIDKWI